MGKVRMKQLIVIADMEGASGIFNNQVKWLWNGGDEWREHGRDCITSDVLAVCRAAVDFGIDDILLYDMHWAGDSEFNVILEKLPSIVRVFDVPNRQMLWRRICGQAMQNPFGLITVGQHARASVENAYFEHTIQSPPIKNLFLNGIHIAEIGVSALSFRHVSYLANIGCAASMPEALELNDGVMTIPVKDLAKGWEPSPVETYPLIYEGTMKALQNADKAKHTIINAPYLFSMELYDEYAFDMTQEISWKGVVEKNRAEWTAPSIDIGLETFAYLREMGAEIPAFSVKKE